MKKVLILGASLNENRISNKLIRLLDGQQFKVVAIGRNKGKIGNVNIQTKLSELNDVHTVSLYLNPKNQKEYYDDILGLKPKKVIFNPGSQNFELENLLLELKIDFEHACSLILAKTNQF